MKSLVCVCVSMYESFPHSDFETADRFAWNLVRISMPLKSTITFTYSLTLSNRNMAGARKFKYSMTANFTISALETPPPPQKKLLCIRIKCVQKNICPGKQTALDCGVAANIRRKYEIRS